MLRHTIICTSGTIVYWTSEYLTIPSNELIRAVTHRVCISGFALATIQTTPSSLVTIGTFQERSLASNPLVATALSEWTVAVKFFCHVVEITGPLIEAIHRAVVIGSF